MDGTFLGVAALLLTVTAMTLWIRALRAVAVPTNRIGYMAAFGVAAGLAIAALGAGAGWVGGISALLSILVAVFFFYTKSIGLQVVDDEAIQVGSAIPAFTAIDEHGQIFDSQELSGHSVLLKFFRGHW